jgi:hypothetical protein
MRWINAIVAWLKIVDKHRRPIRGHQDVGIDRIGRSHVHCDEYVMD